MRSKGLRCAAYADTDKRFVYPLQGRLLKCQIDIFVRADLANKWPWGVIMITQNPSQDRLINEDLDFLVSFIMVHKFYSEGMTAIHEKDLIWLENYAAIDGSRNTLNQFKLEDIETADKTKPRQLTFNHPTTIGLVERIMTYSWGQMGLSPITSATEAGKL